MRVPWTARRSNQSILKEVSPECYCKDWCWSWSSNTLATWCEEPTHLKRPWCWERLKAGEGGNRGWDGWMASPTQWTWVWINSGSRWWTGRPGMLQSMGSQRVRHNWVTKLNWTSFTSHIAPLPPYSIYYKWILESKFKGRRISLYLWRCVKASVKLKMKVAIQSMEFSRPEYWNG